LPAPPSAGTAFGSWALDELGVAHGIIAVGCPETPHLPVQTARVATLVRREHFEHYGGPLVETDKLPAMTYRQVLRWARSDKHRLRLVAHSTACRSYARVAEMQHDHHRIHYLCQIRWPTHEADFIGRGRLAQERRQRLRHGARNSAPGSHH
jgi:hypothetical protein